MRHQTRTSLRNQIAHVSLGIGILFVIAGLVPWSSTEPVGMAHEMSVLQNYGLGSIVLGAIIIVFSTRINRTQ